MGMKSRGNFSVNACFKKCANRDLMTIVEGRSYNFCKECFGNPGNFKPLITKESTDDKKL